MIGRIRAWFKPRPRLTLNLPPPAPRARTRHTERIANTPVEPNEEDLAAAKLAQESANAWRDEKPIRAGQAIPFSVMTVQREATHQLAQKDIQIDALAFDVEQLKLKLQASEDESCMLRQEVFRVRDQSRSDALLAEAFRLANEKLVAAEQRRQKLRQRARSRRAR